MRSLKFKPESTGFEEWDQSDETLPLRAPPFVQRSLAGSDGVWNVAWLISRTAADLCRLP